MFKKQKNADEGWEDVWKGPEREVSKVWLFLR